MSTHARLQRMIFMASSFLPQSDSRSDTTLSSYARAANGRLSREDEAKLALEHTNVTPLLARVLCLLFLLTIALVPTLQSIAKARQHQAIPPALEHLGAIPDAPELKRFEISLERESVASQWILPRAQSVLARLGAGNEQAYIGRDGWLVYRPDVDYLTGTGFLQARVLKTRAQGGASDQAAVQPDPVAAIVRFRDQLAQRGIRLVLMPTPLKPMLQPETLQPETLQARTLVAPHEYSQALQNPSYARFLQQMAQQQIVVCDPTARLEQAKLRTGQAQFLTTDTHWTPDAMQTAATALADSIRQNVELPAQSQTRYSRRAQIQSNRGDIAAMLKVSSDGLFPPQQVTTRQVLALSVQESGVQAPGGAIWKPSLSADVLLLGDSFTNIYSKGAMGWGRGAGLAEQLSFELRRAVDVIAVNAGGASSTRRQLRDDLLRGRDRLAGKRVVAWQFAMRDLANGDWQFIDLPAPQTSTRRSNPSAPLIAPPALRPADPVVGARFRKVLAQKAAAVESSGSEVLHGANGWMFYLPDVYYVSTPGFLRPNRSPQIEALVDFKRQLERRGIRLLVMPAPAKPTIYPEKLGLNAPVPQAPQNPSFAPFRRALAAQGIAFFDPTETLIEQKRRISTPMFMPTDSHWTWAAMDATAAQMARHIQTQTDLPARAPVRYTRRPAQVRNITDISFMLKKQPNNSQFIRVSQTIQQVLTSDGKLWRASPQADVLVMGDSFINMYSHGGYWGKSAGFAEQLSYYLQRPVDLIAMDRGAVNKTRKALQLDMMQGRDRLAGKKLVIYEVASRYLMTSNWDSIALPRLTTKTQMPVSRPAIPTPRNIQVRGTIRAHSPVPQPDTSPYQDMVMTLRLSDLQAVSPQQSRLAPRGDIVVYLWGMRNGALTSGAALKAGQTVTLQLTPWRAVEDEYGSYDRSDLEDRDTARLPRYWAQIKP